MSIAFDRFEKVLDKEFKWLFSKYLNKVKKKYSIEIKRAHLVKAYCFPEGNLQERYLSFIHFYLDFGPQVITELLDCFQKQKDWDTHLLVILNKTEAFE
jgi:uncharacterized protein YllA (UPF0747 family)